MNLDSNVLHGIGSQSERLVTIGDAQGPRREPLGGKCPAFGKKQYSSSVVKLEVGEVYDLVTTVRPDQTER